MTWLSARLAENSTRAALIYLAAHVATLLTANTALDWRQFVSVALCALVVALTPDKQSPGTATSQLPGETP